MSSTHALRLYRSLLRAAKNFPVVRLRSKLEYNIKELTQMRKYEQSPLKIQGYLTTGATALKILTSLSALDEQSLNNLFDDPTRTFV
jgi:hypothetical protein